MEAAYTNKQVALDREVEASWAVLRAERHVQRICRMHRPGRQGVDEAMIQFAESVVEYEQACREADRADAHLHQAVLEDMRGQREQRR
ncbi:hypothetical protein PI125_g10833 [Phytophthora idaei]|nr:hypothetical protein PI125_g10833 [Phytophthora idaei]